LHSNDTEKAATGKKPFVVRGDLWYNNIRPILRRDIEAVITGLTRNHVTMNKESPFMQ
jgi:hypothetical protein